VRIIERIVSVPQSPPSAPEESQITEPLTPIIIAPVERNETINVYVPPSDAREAITRSEVERGSSEAEQKEFVPPNKKSSEDEQKTFAEPNKKRSDAPVQTIPPKNENNSHAELFEGPKPSPLADIPELEKIGSGRQRRYEELGKDDIESVREVVLFRHEFGRHWPGMSDDMETYYEHFYFTKPKRGNKDYDRHIKCWERRIRWIGSEQIKPASNSGKATPIRKRSNG
jgi:hypothetical protein